MNHYNNLDQEMTEIELEDLIYNIQDTVRLAKSKKNQKLLKIANDELNNALFELSKKRMSNG